MNRSIGRSAIIKPTHNYRTADVSHDSHKNIGDLAIDETVVS